MEKFTTQRYEHLLTKFGEVCRENLFTFLGRVQDTFGYVPREVVRDVAARVGLSETRIYGALTSYRDFDVHPEGDG